MNATPVSASQTLTRWLIQKSRLCLAGLSVAALSSLQVMMTPSTTTAFPSFDLLREEDYNICAENLQAVGLSPQVTAQACAMSVRPKQISTCVSRINYDTGISAEEALVGCVSVRRPEEMATCVVNITQNLSDANPLKVLDSCSRSLLPEQYSFCVLGVTPSTALPVTNVLNTCLTPPEQFIDLKL